MANVDLLPPEFDAFDAILHHVYNQTQGDLWFKPSEDNIVGGACIRIVPGQFRIYPSGNPFLEPFREAAVNLNSVIVVKIRTAAVHAALTLADKEDREESDALYVDNNTRIQILDTMELLPTADKEQCAAFIRDERVLVAWAESIDDILPLCTDLDSKLVKLAWRTRPRSTRTSTLATTSSISAGSRSILSSSASLISSYQPSSLPGSTLPSDAALNEKLQQADTIQSVIQSSSEKPSLLEATSPGQEEGTAEKKPNGFLFGWLQAKKPAGQMHDVEHGQSHAKRPTKLMAAFYTGLGAALSVVFVGQSVSILVQEWILDGQAAHFALISTIPLLFCVSLFFTLQVVTNLSYIMGPVAQYFENSKYYSGIAPKANRAVDTHLPHITIQMPVYRESLAKTITPSIQSIKHAMQTYARQGGTSNIFVNDDALQLLPEAERSERIQFYAQHGIGWVARPPHNAHDAEGFKRAGRFKKASNMNYALSLSLKMEQCLRDMQANADKKRKARLDEEERHSTELSLSGRQIKHRNTGSGPRFYDNVTRPEDIEEDESNLEIRALEAALEQTYVESGSREDARPWASIAEARAIRIGEIILLVDSDTVVPADCLRNAARELAESPEVAVLQHDSDVVQVAHHYFENAMAYFARRVYRCISIACAGGEVAPFVGHNAFLRWTALQEVAFQDKEGNRKIWSEANVSEDFDMSLRLQKAGYIVRWATYHNGGFKEGVSLTCDDEISRWQKYAYGCAELMFNPFVQWWRRGPINRQMFTFMWCDAPLHYKFSMLAYMASYYGLAAFMTLAVLNYVVLGMDFTVDGFYLHSFEIWLACLVIFQGAGTVAYTLLEYRLGLRSLVESFVQNLLWIPFFVLFFAGLSVHLSQALLAHLFSYNITWSTTKKEVVRSNFFLEVPKIFRRFWLPLIISVVIIAGMAICSTSLVPSGYRVTASEWGVIYPLAFAAVCHILYPIALNPWLMIFSY